MFDIGALLKKGRLRTDIRMKNTNTASPPKGFMWFLIGGCIYHVNGTGDGFNVRPETLAASPTTANDVMIYKSNIDSSEATGIYPVFNNVAEPYQASPSPMVITSDFRITFLGSATAWFIPFLVEVPV